MKEPHGEFCGESRRTAPDRRRLAGSIGKADAANVVTLSRFCGALLFVSLCSGPQSLRVVALVVLIGSYITDLADGALARRRKVPRPGLEWKVIDSTVDSYIFVIAFSCLGVLGLVPLALLALVITGRSVLELARVMSVAKGLPYPFPTRLTRIKGIFYCFGSSFLYGIGSIDALSALDIPFVHNVWLVLIAAITVGAVLDFSWRNAACFRAMIQ